MLLLRKKVCEKSGKVSFQRKSTDAAGTVTYNDVVFDEGKAMFVRCRWLFNV